MKYKKEPYWALKTTADSANGKVKNIFAGRSIIAGSNGFKHTTAETIHTIVTRYV